MVSEGSPKFNMIARRSPKLGRLLAVASAIKKRNSPKVTRGKKAESSEVQSRACWTAALEKSLVDIVHEHNKPCFRGDNGWNTEGWNKIVKEFYNKNKYASFTRNQIQYKEKELKRDYKMLKEAQKQSGCSWNQDRKMIDADSALWDNLIVSFPKIKKFRNNKAMFPLFDDLGELYDGHLAEGTYNFTSIDLPPDSPLRQIGNIDEIENLEDIMPFDLQDEDTLVHGHEDEGASAEIRTDTLPKKEDVQAASVERITAVQRDKGTKDPKRPKKTSNVEGLIEKYLEMRTKQAEDEATHLAKEKEATQGADFSIKRCISLLNTMEVTKEEKVKAYAVFKSQENREIFLCSCDEDPEAAMMWLRAEMAQQPKKREC